MAERPIWRGHLRLALVSCPVALHTATTERASLHFHFINPDTGHRVRMVTEDAESGETLSRGDLVKGYEFKKDTYLLLTDADFEAARIESSATMVIDKFVARDTIDPIYFESSYFVVPDGDAGGDVFVVLREAIERSGHAALARVVIARRERAVAILPSGPGLVAHTLHDAHEVQDPAGLFARIPKARADAEMIKLATQLIDRQAGRFEPADIVDRYEARLREVIEAKLRGEGIEPEAATEPESNVIDLMAALKNSLKSSEPPAPARAAQAKGAAKEARGPGGKSAPTRKSRPRETRARTRS